MSIDPRSASADEVLQALTVGELAADDARVVARFALEPALRARWQAIAATLAQLSLLDSGMRGNEPTALPSPAPAPASAPAPAPAPVSAPSAGPTRGGVRAPVPTPTSAAGRRWWLLPTLLAAALAAMWVLQERPPAEPDPKLGSDNRPRDLRPDGTSWPGDSPLSWSPVRGAAGYRLELQALPDGAIVAVPEGAAGGALLMSPSWLPAPDQRASLPVPFRWRVIAIERGVEGRELGTSSWATVNR